jgi:hypothetical protein
MDHPDEDLLELQTSLEQYLVLAEHLFADERRSHAFVHFILAGRLQSDANQARIFINARQGVSTPPIGTYQTRRDFDSAFGVTHDLPFKVAWAIFLLPSFRDTLTDDIHMHYNPSDRSKVSSNCITHFYISDMWMV